MLIEQGAYMYAEGTRMSGRTLQGASLLEKAYAQQDRIRRTPSPSLSKLPGKPASKSKPAAHLHRLATATGGSSNPDMLHKDEQS